LGEGTRVQIGCDVGLFGAAANARWHLGNLASFAAWMVQLSDTQQAVVLLLMAIAVGLALQVMGLNAAILSAFAPDFAVVLAAMGTLLCLPVALRAWAWARRSFDRNSQQPP
jgi:hypothetical protein